MKSGYDLNIMRPDFYLPPPPPEAVISWADAETEAKTEAKTESVAVWPIELIGTASTEFVRLVERFFSFARRQAPEFYQFGVENINFYRVWHKSCVEVRARVLNTAVRLALSRIEWGSSVFFAHEPQHVARFRLGQQYWGPEAENDCMQKQIDFFHRIGAPQYMIDYLEELIRNRAWPKMPGPGSELPGGPPW